MRVGIDYRILSVGPALVTRGMGRYTQQQLREVLAVDDRTEYQLLVNDGNDLSLIAPEVLAAENVQIRSYALPPSLADRALDAGVLAGLAEDYQAWLYGLGLDLYHATTPFLLEYPLLLQCDACPMVATFYDVIPLLFPERYYGPDLHNSPFRDHYLRTLGMVKRANRVLAISDAAARDAVDFVGIPAERIDRAWPIPDAVFRPLSEQLRRKLLAGLRPGVRIPADFAMTVTYPHYTKNLETLLAAYGRLPAALRTRLPLVICCYLSDASRRLVMDLAAREGIAEDVVLTGTVSDQQLCALYNQATVLVHPSRYEGFGLPIAEAMACGTPVVTTTSSSMPEVAGDAALLLEPEDVEGFASAIARLARDPAERADLRERGLAQVARFNGAQLAEATLASYAKALAPSGAAGPRRPRLAVWTPLPPQQSGIADYSAELLAGLAPHADLEVFIDDGYLPSLELIDRHVIQHHRAFERRAAQAPFDAVIYQVGGSMFHFYMSRSLQEHPGIVVLHDMMWSHVLYTWFHQQGDDQGFRQLLARLEGPAACQELEEIGADDLEAVWAFLAAHPMLEPLIAASRAQVVHLPAAAAQLQAGYPGARPFVIPMGVADPCAGDVAMTPRLARVMAGLPPDRFTVGVFGIVHPSKRLASCLRGFAAFARDDPEATLVVVGRALVDTYPAELAALAEDLGVGDRVIFTGHVGQHQLDTYLKAADVVLNLRTPMNTHMSATLIRALAAGRPVIINDLPEWSFLAQEVCLRVPSDHAEVPAIAAHLARLAADPERRAQLGQAARGFFLREGTIQAMAHRYLSLVERVMGEHLATSGALPSAPERVN